MQMEGRTVSVIIPIYDVEKYLQSCIDSVCQQTYRQLEIILVDDGSPDQCGEICDRYAVKDSRIFVIHKENGGLSSARNAGLECATGDYISFVDADDTVHPRFVEILVGLAEAYHCDIAQCDFLMVAENSQKLPLNRQQELLLCDGEQAVHELCSGGDAGKFTVAWNKIYKKKLFEGIQYPEGRIHEDEFTSYRILWKAQKMVVTNLYLYYYLQRKTSIMGRRFSVKRLDILDAFRERLCFLREKGFQEDYFITSYKLFNLLEKSYALLKENTEGCEEICSELLREREQIGKEFPVLLEKKESRKIDETQMVKSCSYPAKSRIVLYGAGAWGRIYYRWIQENQKGQIVGWVDNRWHEKQQLEYPVTPLDSLLAMDCDYILITIKNKGIQDQIRDDLACWGMEENKILSIYTDK